MTKHSIFRCCLYILIVLFISIQAGFAAQPEEAKEAFVEQIESELIDQDLIEAPPEEQTAEDQIQAPAELAAPSMMTMSVPGVPTLEESIFSTGSHMATPEISMKIGAAIVNYPIQVPLGRNGLTPGVSLRYNSYQKNSMVGVGWSLNIDAVQRNIRKGLDYTGIDFTYNGEQLVPVSVDSSGYGTYRLARQQNFSTIEYLPDDSWSITLKNGIIYTYGTTASSKQTNTHGIFKWFLENITDTNGNTIAYTYTSELGKIYPATIEYSDYYTISFYYEQRNDNILHYATHAEAITGLKLKTIAIENIYDTIRAYDLIYTDSANTGRSLLSQITLYGSDFGIDTENKVISGSSLPPTEITYNQDLTAFAQSPSSINDLSKGQGFEDTYIYSVITGDFNGDGKTDIGRAGDNSIEFYTSTPTGFESFNALSDLSNGDGYTNNNDYPIITGDWNGDGKTDIGRVKDAQINFYVSTDTGFESFASLSDLSKNQGYTDQNEYPIITGDFNADGKTDVARVHNTGITCYTSTGSDWQPYTGLTALGKTQGYPNSSEYPLITGDFNGDGKTDIARVADASVIVYVSTGTTFTSFGSLPFFGKTLFPNNNEHPIVTGDFNGDGLTDIARPDNNNFIIYLSTGTGFVYGTSISNDLAKNEGYPTFNDNPMFTGDFNDDGRTDVGRISGTGAVVYVSQGDAFALYSGINDLSSIHGFTSNLEYPLVTGDFEGKGKTSLARMSDTGVVFYTPDSHACDLASEFISSSGNITQITYTPSSEYDNTLLPFVMQIVSQITTNDGLGNTSTTAYTYTGGLYDYEHRELRSFETATKTNPDTTTEITQFHQDQFLDGKPVYTEFRASDDTTLSRTDYTWTSTPYDTESAFIKLDSKTSTMYEKGQTAFLQEDYTYINTHGSIETTTISGTGLTENITTTYTYDYYGAGGISYPLRTTSETLSGFTAGMSRQTNYTYESITGNLLAQEAINTSGSNPATIYTYDNYGNVASITDPKGNVTYYDYDSVIDTYAVVTTKPMTGSYSHITQYPSIDYRYGKPLIFENENNYQTAYAYDVFGRVIAINYPDNGEETYTYDDASMPKSVTKSIKDTDTTTIDTITYLDGFGRTIQAVSPSKDDYAVSLFTFDNMGRPECVKGQFFNADNTFLSSAFTGITSDPSTINSGITSTWARNYYDERSRAIQIEQSGDINIYMDYENLQSTVTDSDGHAKTQETDILGQIISITEHGPTDNITSYTYNTAGDLLNVSRTNPDTGSPIDNTVSYNTLGQKVSMTDPDMGTWGYTYDLNGNLVTQTDARNVTLIFEYDELNRQTKKTYPDQTFVQFEYDAGTNGMGLLYQKSNANASSQYSSYDEFGRPLSETRTIDTTIVKYDYTYDPAGRQASKAVTKDNILFKTLKYEFYTGTSLLKTVMDNNNQAYTEITQYSPQGKIEFMNNYNTTVTNYIYDYTTARLSVIHSYNMSQDIIDKSYTYSKAGDVTEIVNNREDITYTYDYDHLHRLVSEQSSGTGAQDGTSVEVIEFTYDEAGNPVHAPSQITNNGATTSYDYTTTGTRSNKVEGIETTSYVSNDDNIISQLTVNGTTTSFYYDADNKRIKKTQGIGSTLYFGQEFEIINNTPTLYVFAGNLRVAKVTDATLEYYHKDHLGSTSAISREDGTIIDLGEYMPYGLDRSSNALLQTSSYKFTDQELDDGTGLYNYDARLYDPLIGQFIMADTIVPDLFNPQSLNRYAYCLNNPVKYIDPTGHEPFYGNFFMPKDAKPVFGTTAYGPNSGWEPGGKYSSPIEKYGIFAHQIAKIHDPVVTYSTKNLGLPFEVVNFPTMIPSAVVAVTYTIVTSPINLIDSISESNTNTNTSNDGLNDFGYNGYDGWGNHECAAPGDVEYGGVSSDNDGSDGTIICTELYRQGLMSIDIYKADAMFGRSIRQQNPNVLVGYHYLCGPIVKLMQKSNTITQFVNIFAKPWSYEMAYRVGVRLENNMMGRIIMSIGIPLCASVGEIITGGIPSINLFVILLLSVLIIIPTINYTNKKNGNKQFWGLWYYRKGTFFDAGGVGNEINY